MVNYNVDFHYIYLLKLSTLLSLPSALSSTNICQFLIDQNQYFEFLFCMNIQCHILGSEWGLMITVNVLKNNFSLSVLK